MTDEPVRYLVLWDIDQTLIDTCGLGTELFQGAFEAATGRPVERQATVVGRTELAIFSSHLVEHGIEPADNLISRYSEELARRYEANTDQLRRRGTIMPGALEAVTRLASAPSFAQSVLTGNIRPVARTKLQTFGLAAHIDFQAGAYGDDDYDRSNLVAVAQSRAGAAYGTVFDSSNTVLVGDTVEDVIAAKRGGAAIVAVASGRDSASDLREAGAPRVLDDLSGVVPAIRAALESA